MREEMNAYACFKVVGDAAVQVTQSDDGREAAFPQRAIRVDISLRAPIAYVSGPAQRPRPVLAEQSGIGAWNLRFGAKEDHIVAAAKKIAAAKKTAYRPG